MKRMAGFAFLILMLAACDPAIDSPDPAVEEVMIHEALYRKQIATHGQYLDRRDTMVYFLSFVAYDSAGNVTWEQDAPDQILVLFEDFRGRIRKFSDCRYGVNQGVFDKQSNRRGIIFRSGTIHRMNDYRVEIEGGYFSGGIHAHNHARIRYSLEKSKGRWWVVGLQYLQ